MLNWLAFILPTYSFYLSWKARRKKVVDEKASQRFKRPAGCCDDDFEEDRLDDFEEECSEETKAIEEKLVSSFYNKLSSFVTELPNFVNEMSSVMTCPEIYSLSVT